MIEGQDISQPPAKKMSMRASIIWIVSSFLVLCVICVVAASIFSDPATPTPTAAAQIEATEEATATPEPTEEPTNTPAPPTATEAPTDTPEPEPTDIPTDIPAPINTPTPEPTEEPTEAPAPVAEALIPGLLPADVTLNLEERGFTCAEVEEFEDNFIWTCELEQAGHQFVVEVWSRELLTVDLIDSNIMNPDGVDKELAAQFLGFMATMPYEGSSPEEARAWVEDNFPTLDGTTETEFGGVRYNLLGWAVGGTLEMGNFAE